MAILSIFFHVGFTSFQQDGHPTRAYHPIGKFVLARRIFFILLAGACRGLITRMAPGWRELSPGAQPKLDRMASGWRQEVPGPTPNPY